MCGCLRVWRGERLADEIPSPPLPPAQTWCRGKKKWECESLCLDCHSFSFRSYCDPDFKTPEEYEKERWQQLVKGGGEAATVAAS